MLNWGRNDDPMTSTGIETFLRQDSVQVYKQLPVLRRRAFHNAASPTTCHYEGSKVMSVLPPDPPAWNVSSHSLQWLQAPRLKELVPGLMP